MIYNITSIFYYIDITNRLFPITLVVVWLGTVTLQSLGILKFGSQEIALSWVSYSALIFLAFLLIDAFTKFRINSLKYLYFFILADFVIFNLAIIFDWYSHTQIINRAEHMVGSMLVCFAIYIIVRSINPTRNLSLTMQVLIALSIANFLVVLNEVSELILDYLFNTQSIGPGIWDTNLDLLMNLVGFAVFALGMALVKRNH